MNAFSGDAPAHVGYSDDFVANAIRGIDYSAEIAKRRNLDWSLAMAYHLGWAVVFALLEIARAIHENTRTR